MKVVAIIQARMGSTRLPGKVLMDIAGQPMLHHVVTRCRLAQRVDEVVVATSEHARDDAIVQLCEQRGWLWFRGSENDVLDRYWRAAQKHEADVVVRVTSDCPLLAPQLVDRVIDTLLSDPAADYTSNILEPRRYPRGLDVEAIRVDALDDAWRYGRGRVHREHVTPFIWSQPKRFNLQGVWSERDFSKLRWTVDTEQDLELVRVIFAMGRTHERTWREIATWLEAHPEIYKLNTQINQKEL